MSTHLELYYFEECPYCQRVMKVIRELSIKVDYKNVRKNPEHRDFHLKSTGLTQVPCLYIDGKPMFESADIIQWLQKNVNTLEKLN